ncbi:hypothetical protein EAZG_04908 [Escherichia coli TA249]|nr:DUF551 domain-containing protein [Escherichia coli]OSL89762.1 hypothetical protein EAZG_04908 [Escherichia coli TA249]
MTTFTDKELIKEIKERIGSLDVRDNIERRAYDIALASLTAEPVAWKATFTQIDREYNTFTGMYSDKAEVERWVRLHKACNFRADITPLYTAQPVPVTPDGWISCSERMPNDKQYVWCWGKSYGWTECDTFEGYYDWSRNKWWAVTDDGEEPASKVTHWMPLPEPPQEVNHG